MVLADDNQPSRPVTLSTPVNLGRPAVKAWLLVRNFVSAETPATGYGKRNPVAPNQKPDGSDNPAGRQLNRRVEVVLDTCR